MATKRTFFTWLAASVLAAFSFAGFGSAFASSSIVTASAATPSLGLGAAGSLGVQEPCQSAAAQF